MDRMKVIQRSVMARVVHLMIDTTTSLLEYFWCLGFDATSMCHLLLSTSSLSGSSKGTFSNWSGLRTAGWSWLTSWYCAAAAGTGCPRTRWHSFWYTGKTGVSGVFEGSGMLIGLRYCRYVCTSSVVISQYHGSQQTFQQKLGTVLTPFTVCILILLFKNKEENSTIL